MEDFEKEVRMIAEKAASREEIITFLKVCAENISLPLQNLLLVYEQKPTAKTVCGKTAWKQLGREVKADAVPIRIRYPIIEPKKDVIYRFVNVYDYDSTEGSDLKLVSDEIVWADRITQLTGATWEMVPEEALKGGLGRGFYDRDKNVFYLSKLCAGEQQEQTILGLYVDYVLLALDVQDKLVRLAVTFVISERLGFRSAIVRILFGKLEKMLVDEKWEFLKRVCYVSKKVLDDLTGYRLSFHEVAFVNSLMVSEDLEEMRRIFEQAAEGVSNEELRRELLVLENKLLKMKHVCRAELYRKRCRMQLFTYPPEVLEFEEEDFLQEERGNYNAK